jgi:precorrin-6Y C5,15-methyltransferase (decarboxylating)
MTKIYVIGIGYKALDNTAREIVLASEIILASKRLFEVFKGYKEYEAVKDKIKVINNVDETIAFIHSAIHPASGGSAGADNSQSAIDSIVLLASGDPAFFGIGRRAVREFGKDAVEIIPDLSSIQIAFSRIKESWDDAFLMSLHGGPDPKKRRRLPYESDDIPYLLQRHNKILILTDKENNPSVIAKVLLESSALLLFCSSALKVYVCEKLGYPDEKITEGSPEEIAGMSFAEPNIVIIQNLNESSFSLQAPALGLRENEIAHSRGLITKDEVRAVTVHKLRLPKRGVLWDIGAGSGSVSIEAARLYPELKVIAVEKNEEQIKNIKENRIKFDATNIEIIKGQAPDALINLPAPDRVFIGGSGGKLKEIIDLIAKTQTAIIVINAATVETLNIAVAELQRNGFLVDVSQVSVSRMKKIREGSSFSALNPVFVIVGEKS